MRDSKRQRRDEGSASTSLTGEMERLKMASETRIEKFISEHEDELEEKVKRVLREHMDTIHRSTYDMTETVFPTFMEALVEALVNKIKETPVIDVPTLTKILNDVKPSTVRSLDF